MKTLIQGIILGILLLLLTNRSAWSQPTISSFRLRGEAATGEDVSHFYASNSVSLGANVIFSVVAGGKAPLRYQWQFNQTELPGETNSTLSLTNIQLAHAGDYRVVVTNLTGVTNRQATLSVDPTFTKITRGPIVTDEDHSPGGTWGDYDNDGFLDLFVYNGMDGVAYEPYLYHNQRDGTFTKITSEPLVKLLSQAFTACWGDYDNDGNLDLYTSAGPVNLLYRNKGEGHFTRITNSVVAQVVGSGGWVDYDRDGFLDLFLARYDGAGYTNAHNLLYRNLGDGTFTSITNLGLVTDLGSFAGGAWGDYDNDGNPDIFLSASSTYANFKLPSRLYHNNGDGTFNRITAGSLVIDKSGDATSCAWGDYDNDGFLDLFIANENCHPNLLYHNNRDGTFGRMTNGIVTNDKGNFSQSFGCTSLGCAWGDYDNDGWLDLYVGNEGGPDLFPTIVNFLYHNNRNGTFTKITTGSPVNEYSDSWGVVWADYDNDGFLDLFASRGDGRGNYLYRNNGNSNSWLTVSLEGTASNRSAIGAKVRIQATLEGTSRQQLREINGGGALYGHNELRANFGLGDATNIDWVRIEWPSGIVQTMTNVAPRQRLTVVEHQSQPIVSSPRLTGVSVEAEGGLKLSVTGDPGLIYVLEASTNLVHWTKVGVRSNAVGTLSFFDTQAARSTHRFYRTSIP